MFGYACNETEELMPAPVMFAHRILRKMAEIRHAGENAPWLRPVCKSQVALQYEDGKMVGIKNVVVSTQHTADVSNESIRQFITEDVVKPSLPEELLSSETEYLINPTGRFVIGGPQGDSGLTGRKIIVDTYGGWGRHGGGAFSGKDPSKVDRSAAYMCRWVAKNVFLLDWQIVQRFSLRMQSDTQSQPASLSIVLEPRKWKKARLKKQSKRFFHSNPQILSISSTCFVQSIGKLRITDILEKLDYLGRIPVVQVIFSSSRLVIFKM